MSIAPFERSGRVGEGVLEGVECVLRRDRELEAVAGADVLDRNGHPVLTRVPEQQNVDAVALAFGELAGLGWCGAHSSSLSLGRGGAKPGHGMSTSDTLVAVVRSAT